MVGKILKYHVLEQEKNQGPHLELLSAGTKTPHELVDVR